MIKQGLTFTFRYQHFMRWVRKIDPKGAIIDMTKIKTHKVLTILVFRASLLSKITCAR